jgi:hypothetical protein
MSTTTVRSRNARRRAARRTREDGPTTAEVTPRVIELQVRRVELWPRFYR